MERHWIETAADGPARSGEVHTDHGVVRTPAFMPVGTQATVKGLTPGDLETLGVDIVLANAYHLSLRPGPETVRDLGGLHGFMGWKRPILTDSGGYQVFSLADLRETDSDGVTFRSHLDGTEHRFTPESVVDLEVELGADIVMVFDDCAPYPCEREEAVAAAERTLRWAERSLERHRVVGPGPWDHRRFLYAIVQGSVYSDLRRENAAALADLDFDGYGIGGLSVGEPKSDMRAMLEVTIPALPADKPRYLMGVGFPEDIVMAIGCGVDMFDSVAPTRHGRTGAAFTSTGRVNIENARFATDDRPLDETCACAVCATWSRGYIRHLFRSNEMLGPRLLSYHNIAFLVELTEAARKAIRDGVFESWSSEWIDRYRSTSKMEVPCSR